MESELLPSYIAVLVHLFFNFLHALIPELDDTGISRSLSQQSLGKGRMTPWTSHQLTDTEKQTTISKDNLDFSTNLTSMFLVCGRNSENLEKYPHKRKKNMQTQKGIRPRIEPLFMQCIVLQHLLLIYEFPDRMKYQLLLNPHFRGGGQLVTCLYYTWDFFVISITVLCVCKRARVCSARCKPISQPICMSAR